MTINVITNCISFQKRVITVFEGIVRDNFLYFYRTIFRTIKINIFKKQISFFFYIARFQHYFNKTKNTKDYLNSLKNQ